MKRPVVWCTAAFVCGTVLKFRFSVLLLIVFISCILYTAYAYKKLSYLILIPVLLSGMLPSYLYNKTHLEPISEYQTADISFRIVEADRHKSSGGYKCYLVKTTPSQSFPFKADGYVYTYSHYIPEQLVTADCTIFPVSCDDDYDIRLINKELEFTAVSYSGKVTGTHNCGILCKIRALRNLIISEIEESISPKNTGFLSAILTGDKELLTNYRTQTFRMTGISHIMAVSGFHVSALLGFLHMLLGILHIKGIAKNIICTLFLLFLIPFMNFSPSAIRAVIMGIVLLWSVTFRRDNDSLTSLCLAAMIILCFRPYALMDLSFVLSFTATAGIILLSPFFRSLFLRIFGTDASALSCTLAVHIFLIPSNIFYFGSISLISIPANLLFVPLFPFIMFMLIITVLFGRFLPQLCSLLDFITGVYLGAVENFSMIPSPSVNITASGPLVFVLIITAALALCFKNKMRLMFGFLSLLLSVSIGISAYKTAFGNRIILISDDNLYATVVSTPEKTLAAADFGEGADFYDYSKFVSLMQQKGIKKIDFFYIINYNSDEEYFLNLLKNEYNPGFFSNQGIWLNESTYAYVSDNEISVCADFPVIMLSDNTDTKYRITGKIGKPQLNIRFKDNEVISFKNSVTEIRFNDKKITEIKSEEKNDRTGT